MYLHLTEADLGCKTVTINAQRDEALSDFYEVYVGEMKTLQQECLWFRWSHIRTSEVLWSWGTALSSIKYVFLIYCLGFFTASFWVWRTCTLAVGSDLLAINLCTNKGTLPGKELTSDPFIGGGWAQFSDCAQTRLQTQWHWTHLHFVPFPD